MKAASEAFAAAIESPQSRLERIIANGNMVPRGDSNWIVCPDGFKLSVIAGPGAYCTPRPALISRSPWDDVDEDYPGPYLAVEVGYPSQQPEPNHCSAWSDGWDDHDDHPVCDGWDRYGDSESSVYGYVPVEMVRALVAAHCSPTAP